MGLQSYPECENPDEEKTTLDTWAARQIAEPFLRFGGEDGPSTVDPSVLTENIGNDPLLATQLGFKTSTVSWIILSLQPRLKAKISPFSKMLTKILLAPVPVGLMPWPSKLVAC